MDSIHCVNFTVEAIHTDCFGRAKPSALLYFVQQAAGEHCTLLGVDAGYLEDKNLFWAVTRTKAEITRLPTDGETITVKTWPMPTSRVAYPRTAVGYDGAGKELFRAVSLWVLMDKTTRTMVLPGKSGVWVEGILTGDEPEIPRAIGILPMEQETSRTVGYTLLDQNGHMNNTRYLDWLDDLLDGDFHRDHPAREFTVCYLSEARERDEITLHYALTDGHILTADGRRNGERIFSAQLFFDNIL